MGELGPRPPGRQESPQGGQISPQPPCPPHVGQEDPASPELPAGFLIHRGRALSQSRKNLSGQRDGRPRVCPNQGPQGRAPQARCPLGLGALRGTDPPARGPSCVQPAGRAASSGGLSGRLPGHPHCPAPHALAQTQTWEENGAIDFPRQRCRVPLRAFTGAFKSHSTSTKEQITHRPGCSNSLSLQTLVGRAGRAGGSSEESWG